MTASREEIRGWLRDGNVGLEARRTTMKVSGFEDLKVLVDTGALWSESEAGNQFIGLVLYPAKGVGMDRVRLAAHLLVKDTILNGWRQVEVQSLSNIMDMIQNGEGFWKAALRKYNAVVIMDFYDHGIEGKPFTEEMQYKVQNAILQAIDHGVGITTVATKPLVLEDAKSWHWYTRDFLKIIHGRNISVGIQNV